MAGSTASAVANSHNDEKAIQRSKGKTLACHVQLLDGDEVTFDVDRDAKAPAVLDQVFSHLNVLEKDYFGLYWIDKEDDRHWLDPRKMVRKQVKDKNYDFMFGVKFYALDPNSLHEDITRYQVCLQVRKDIATGKLPVSPETACLLASFAVQAEFGDYDPSVHKDNYLSDYEFIPNQPVGFLSKVKQQHKEHVGQTPADAENHLLEHAKRLEMFGVDLHRARDHENVDIQLGVSGNGMDVYRDDRRINRFSWPKVMKISFRRKKYSIKIRPSENDEHETTVSFRFDSPKKAKLMWRISVEHHVFYRMAVAAPAPKRTGFLRMGSKFRYSGRTLRQLKQLDTARDQPKFERKPSKRGRNERSQEPPTPTHKEPLSYAPSYVASPQAEAEARRLSSSAGDIKAMISSKPQPAHDGAAAQTDIDPDYQELNEETDGDKTEPAEERKDDKEKEERANPESERERADSDEFASYSVPETGLQVEIQTALLSSPVHGSVAADSDVTDSGFTVTASGESMGEETLTVNATESTSPAAENQSQTPLDAMLADLEPSQQPNGIKPLPEGGTATGGVVDVEVKTKQDELLIADQLDALAADLSALKQES
ncbi:band 4.1-like protein 1 isoform X2 [Corticium candelabrum]|uniref:band 4.1-like protein 1 isoform X2 n=1 Tax=Corticium candelabrum TaxID=121492 RepID=UPI002E274C72|nr:band 4.1-like protein 1 isoform X2 [Corticium candelabrum]